MWLLSFHRDNGTLGNRLELGSQVTGPGLVAAVAPRFQAQQSFGLWSTNRRRRPRGIHYHECFNKDVILLPNPTWEVICKPPFKQYLHENGHILSAFEFHKSWDYHTVIQQIRGGFGSTIPQNVSLQILMGCGNKLISPKLQDGQQLNGQLIQKVFRSKALYVKPSQTVLEDPELRNVTSYEVSPRTTRAMTRNKQLNTPENALPYNTDVGNFGEELPEIDHSTFCPSDNSHSNMPPSATTETQSATTINEPTPHASSNYTTYLSVMSSVSDLSSDDEEMNHAILAMIDLCGPWREFLRLLIEALSMSPMFEGPEECKHLAKNSTALREDRYFMAGWAIAVSLVHGGPAPRFLSPVLFAGLVGGPNAVCPTLKDITDADLQEKLKTVSESSTLEELPRAIDPLLDYMTSAGCVRPLRAINDRDLLLHDLLMFHVAHRVQGPFQRQMFPLANTCINCLKLPLVTSYEVFKENMDFAIANTQGFGKT
ncbi:uncharacterized protein LOC119794066 [Cyprinodon tularosa]|uniref:uncharacterized protein LOC119794066 n=1 Tax=Cyprinodon tularosa TaxID=77115 RepID=UPI0018E246B9|nr:uncharacterized protein LOC119794066 [Cyprinodon tularosa]